MLIRGKLGFWVQTGPNPYFLDLVLSESCSESSFFVHKNSIIFLTHLSHPGYLCLSLGLWSVWYWILGCWETRHWIHSFNIDVQFDQNNSLKKLCSHHCLFFASLWKTKQNNPLPRKKSQIAENACLWLWKFYSLYQCVLWWYQQWFLCSGLFWISLNLVTH